MKLALKKLHYRNFIFLTVAGIINAIGVTIFLVPVNLFDSGISGTSFLMNEISPEWMTLSFFLIILNFPFYIIGNKKLGFSFVIYSLYAITIYALVSLLIQKYLPIDWSHGSPIILEDKLLGAIFGGLISGIGSGLVIRYGGAIDGVEVMAVLFAKKIGITVGTFVMIYNILLYSISALIYSSWQIPLYSIIAYYIGLKAVDFVVDGLDKAKSALIITNRANEISEIISNEMKRGVTMWNGLGFYTKQDRSILYIVVNRFEIAKLKALVKQTDPLAFVSISEVSDSMGVKFKFGKNNYHLDKIKYPKVKITKEKVKKAKK